MFNQSKVKADESKQKSNQSNLKTCSKQFAGESLGKAVLILCFPHMEHQKQRYVLYLPHGIKATEIRRATLYLHLHHSEFIALLTASAVKGVY